MQRLDGLGELLGGPGACLQIDVLVGACGDEGVIVDGHALHVHGKGVGVALAVPGEADALAGGVDLLLVGVVPHVGQIGQHALCAPCFDETIRLGQQNVGGHAVHGGAELVVAGGLVQTLYRHVNVGVYAVELGQQRLHGGRIAPVACGERPQRQLDHGGLLVLLRLLAAPGKGQKHQQSQQQSQ